MPDVADVLRPVLPVAADEVIATIAREIPAYERPMEGLFGQMVRLGVETALRRFVDGPTGPGGDTYVNLGRGEYHAGRSLENLLAAYRIGARVTWRRFVEAGTAGGLTPAELYDIGEAIFAYIDTLSSESAEGYALEARAEAGERRRARWELVDALATGGDLPAGADWDSPREVAALVVDAGGEDAADAADRLARDIGAGVVATARDGLVVAFVGDPGGPGRRALIESAVGERRAALGPIGDPARSLRRALTALGPPELVDAEGQLGHMLLRADPELAEELAASRLAPLAGAERLEPTLRAWLDRPGQIQAIAHELGVHPQTVRYRLRQLRERFGTALEDPDARFELALALRARR
jgi:hypothetical protein